MKSLLFTAILSLRKRSEQLLIKFAILLQVRLTHAQTFFRGVIKWTSNYFGVEKHFSTHACLFRYKTEHENIKRSSEVVLKLSKTVFLLVGNTLRCKNMQELVTVQQMANGNFVKQMVVRRNVWQYKYFF